MISTPASIVGDALVQRHPLQRMNSPSRGVSAALHILTICFAHLVDNPNNINFSYGWHFQYLTIIGLTLATTTFIFGLLADIFASRRLFQVKNALSVCSAPMEVLVSLLYWGLSSIDKSLVFPDFVTESSLQVDFGFHAIPAVVLTLDLLFFSPPWTVSVLPALGLSSAISISYWFWVEQCYSRNGFYPYPIFDIGITYRGLLFLGSALTMTANTALLQWVYRRLNGSLPGEGEAGKRVK